MAWTDKMVEDLKNLWQTGLTTSEIAKKLGVSKNSIVGKVHRLSLSGRPSPIKKKEETQKIKVKTPKKNKLSQEKEEKFSVQQEDLLFDTENEIKIDVVSEVIVPVENGSSEENVRLTDLDNHTCRWPIGDPRDENFHFCGKKVRTGQTYCEEHSSIAYVKR